MVLRSVRESFGRFAAIFIISALGVGFLAGLEAATPDMLLTGTRYFNSGRLADVRLLSNIGLDDSDLRAVASVEGIGALTTLKSADLLFDRADGVTIGVTVNGIDRNEPLDSAVNALTLTAGRLPENENECLIEAVVDTVRGVWIGDTITFSAQNDEDASDSFLPRTLTVVGEAANPYYMSLVREQTTVGTGRISEVIYVWNECFDTDYYTAFYMTVAGADETLSMSDDYDALVQPVVDRLEDLAETQKYARHDKVVGEAREKIDDAWATYYEKEQEADDSFAEAERKIADAERDIADGEKELADKSAEGRQKIADGEQELRDAYQKLIDGQKEYEDGLKEYEDGKKEYEDGLKEYEDGLKEYEDGLRDWQEGREKYEDGLRDYEDGKKEYDEGAEELEKARIRLARGENVFDMTAEQLADGRNALAAAQQELDETAAGMAAMLGLQGVTTARQLLDVADSNPMAAAALADYLPMLRGGQAQIDAQAAAIEAGQAQLDEGFDDLVSGREEYEKGKKELEDAHRALLDAWLTLEDARRELEDGEKELADARRELDDAEIELRDAKQELEDAEAELADARKELEDGWKEYYDGLKELQDARVTLDREVSKAQRDIEQGKRDLADGKKELADAEEDARQKLDDARYEIEKAESKLDDIAEPKWYVLDRSGMMTPASFDSNIEKVASIARVFPVFFFLIAALVCSTTMTRMVEEERGVIGTMKALGYSSGAISAKYLLYALLASLLGAILGLTAGFRIFPTVIWNAYGIMYRLPKLYTPFNVRYAVVSTGVTLIAILGATALVCRRSLSESPASLLLPKAPQPGKRVFLENITPLWRRLSFRGKVTARNLLRYKKRFFMTVVGVTGCTALLVTGFGLQNSIDDILRNQFDELWKFDLEIGLKDDPDVRLLGLVEGLDGWIAARRESGKVTTGGARSEVYVYVPEDAGRFAAEYVDFRTRKGHIPVDFGPGKVVLTEKAGRTIGVQPGQTVTFLDGDDEAYTLTVTGVTENYIQSYLYIAPDVYEAVFGGKAETNLLLCRAGCETKEERDALAEKVLKCSSATSATFTEDTAESFGDAFDSIDMIVWVLIFSAGALAFVVLYNLTNINIGERHKELATLKVLGFFEPEVASYILRETNLLSLIGSAAGLLAGKVLHAFVAATAEVDAVMFGRVITPLSYFWAFALSMTFSLLVSAAMLPSLRRVNMVESLKAPE